MFLDKAGEHIADIMTMNRHYADIPSASAILDTSNYTFHAITFGKDAEGFRNHAHTIISPSATRSIKVLSYDGLSVSNYHSSSTAVYNEFSYKLLPNSPFPMDTRLERGSTLPNYTSAVPDLGHCLNSVISPTLSAFSHLIGCFPASGGTNYNVYNFSGGLIFSGSLSSYYNSNSLMDASGFLTFAPYTLPTQQIGYLTEVLNQGVLRSAESSFPNDVDLKFLLTSGDAGALLLYGGVYHLGLWTLDLREMLRLGYYPPYSFNALNNTRKYRIFAKKTSNKDLLQVDSNTYLGASSFVTMFQNGVFANGKGMVIKWKLKFV
jgi:hypothetical protein